MSTGVSLSLIAITVCVTLCWLPSSHAQSGSCSSCSSSNQGKYCPGCSGWTCTTLNGVCSYTCNGCATSTPASGCTTTTEEKSGTALSDDVSPWALAAFYISVGVTLGAVGLILDKLCHCGIPSDLDHRPFLCRLVEYWCPGVKNYLVTHHEVVSLCFCVSHRVVKYELGWMTRVCLLIATLGYRFSLAVVFANANATYIKTTTTCGVCPNCSVSSKTTSSLGGGFSFDFGALLLNIACTYALSGGTRKLCEGVRGRASCLVNLVILGISGAIAFGTIIMELVVVGGGAFTMSAYMSAFISSTLFTWVVTDNVINVILYYIGYLVSGREDYSELTESDSLMNHTQLNSNVL
jgi:hypothetical protein